MNLVHGGMADVVQFLHLLLARQRRLRHMDRLIEDAVTEALFWLPVPLQAEALSSLNAATYDARVWQAIERESAFGSGATDTVPSQVAVAQSVLLQPNFPTTLQEMRDMLPGVPDRVLQGYRRRAWQRATAALVADGTAEPSNGATTVGEDADLMLIQRRDDQHIANWPVDVQRPPHPVRDLPGRRLGPGRRRGREVRPRPRWHPDPTARRRGRDRALRRRERGQGSARGDAVGTRERSRSRDT